MRRFISRLADRVLGSVLSSTPIAGKVLTNLPLPTIRSHFGDEFLSPIQKFAKDGYTNRVYSDLSLTESSHVVLLGGYLGSSTLEYRGKFGCFVHVFEPIEDFVKVITKKFLDDTKVIIYPYAAARTEGVISLHVDGEKTGIYQSLPEVLNVKSIDIAQFTRSLEQIDLFEINIEGGEYEVLERLIDAHEINRIPTILVQFHNYGLETEMMRAKVRLSLSETHLLVYSYDWVWERWDIRH